MISSAILTKTQATKEKRNKLDIVNIKQIHVLKDILKKVKIMHKNGITIKDRQKISMEISPKTTCTSQ